MVGFATGVQLIGVCAHVSAVILGKETRTRSHLPAICLESQQRVPTMLALPSAFAPLEEFDAIGPEVKTPVTVPYAHDVAVCAPAHHAIPPPPPQRVPSKT